MLYKDGIYIYIHGKMIANIIFILRDAGKSIIVYKAYLPTYAFSATGIILE